MTPPMPATVNPTEPERLENDRSAEVLITGYGAFDDFIRNPSYEIISRLPESILNVPAGVPDIRLHIYPKPVKVSYQHVFQLVPQLYESYPNVNFFVHVGVHEDCVRPRIERLARKGPYTRLDVDGRQFSEENVDAGEIWEKAPSEIKSSVDVNEIVKKLTTGGTWDLEASDDAALFLCEFIYFNSLAIAQNIRSSGRKLYGIFFHVPPSLLPDDLDRTRDSLVRVIQEMVRQKQT